jgi:hypothetical protein
MKKLDSSINSMLREMSRGTYVGHRDQGFQVVPGENYYIFAGGTKPFHAGHDQMIMHAINDSLQDPNGRVLLFIGLGDRDILRGEDMQTVWSAYIEDYYESMSPNIYIEYGGGPIGKVLTLLKQANDLALAGLRSENMFYIYSDPEDTQDYYLLPKYSKKDPSIELKSSPPKYTSALRALDPPGVSFMGADYPERFTRGGKGGTINISGTKMREYLAAGNNDKFMIGLPNWMSDTTKQDIFTILARGPLTEISRAEKGTLEYSDYLEALMDELRYVKSSYNSRKKASSRYRKEASKMQDAYSELRRLKRKNDKLLLSEPKENFDRDGIKEWFARFKK